jgi:large subunit ribosomal protein L4
MTKISVKDIKGEKVKDLTLKDAVWNVEVNEDVLKKMIRLQLAAVRQGTKGTKTRQTVSGGGRKPWRQKGTGRARQGSIRATQWRGGAIAFGGIENRDYSFKINRKERVIAIKSALSSKVQNKELVVVDNIKFDSMKTKDLKDLLKTLKLEGKVMFITKEDNEKLYMAGRNLENIAYLLADEINCYDLINADVVVCDEAAINYIEEVLK